MASNAPSERIICRISDGGSSKDVAAGKRIFVSFSISTVTRTAKRDGHPIRRSCRTAPRGSPSGFRPDLGEQLSVASRRATKTSLQELGESGGKALRSTLPFGVKGIFSMPTKTEGIMKTGRSFST